MFRLRKIAMRDYQESVITGQTDTGQSDPYMPLCFAGDTKITAIILSITSLHNFILVLYLDFLPLSFSILVICMTLKYDENVLNDLVHVISDAHTDRCSTH